MVATKAPIPKICMFCQNLFPAQKSTTQFCSQKCAAKAYKVRKRDEKKQEVQKENLEKLSVPLKALEDREYLSVSQAANLLGVSRWTIQRALKQGKLKSTKLLGRRIISQQSFNQLFKS